MRNSFVKHMRDGGYNLLVEDSKAYLLLSLISFRAKRIDDDNKFYTACLEINQAFIGDYEIIGLTRGEYRSAQKKLTKYGLAVFKSTNQGTIATIISTHAMDINSDQSQTSIKPKNHSIKMDKSQSAKNQIEAPIKPLTRKEEGKKKTTTQNADAVLYRCLEDCTVLTEQEKRSLLKYSEERVNMALKWAETATIKTTLIQALHWHCSEQTPPESANSRGTPQQREAWQFNEFLKAQGYEELYKKNQIGIANNIFYIPLSNGTTSVSLSNPINILKK